MAYDIGPKIGIEGEAEFRAAITNINQNIKTLGTEMKAVTSAYDKNDQSAEKLTAQNEVLNKQIAAQKEKLALLKEGLEAAAKEFGENDSRTLKWQASVNTATAGLNKMERQLEANTDELQNGRAGMKDLGEETEKTGDKISALTVAMGTLIADGIKALTSSVIDFAKSSLDAGMSFDSTMSEVSAISGATGDQFDALRDKAMEMGASTKFSATESAEAFTYMAMAGWKTEDMLDGIEGVMSLAAASGEDLASTSDIVTDALTAFGMSAEDSSRFADVLAAASSNANTNVSMLGESFKYVAPVAGSLGYSAEDTAVALGLMANSGIKASQSGTALRTMLTNMANPTDKMASAMLQLGVSLVDDEGNMKSLMDVMEDLRTGFGGGRIATDEFRASMVELNTARENGEMTEKEYQARLGELITAMYGAEGAEKAQLAAMLAGKEGMSGLLAIVNASDEDFQKLTGSIYESEGAAAAMAETMSDNLAGDITLFQSALEGAQIAIADQLNPSLRELVQFGTDAISTLSAAFQEGGLDGAMDALDTILTDGLALILSNLPQMANAGGQLIVSLAGGFLSQLPAIISAAFELVSTLSEGIAEALPELIPAAVDTVLQIVDTLTDPDSLSKLIDAALSLITALAEGLIKALPTLAARTPEIIANIVTTLAANLPKIGAAAVEIVLTLATGLVGAIPELAAAVPKLIASIVGGFSKAGEEFRGIGKNIVTGVWTGIQNMGRWIKDKVTGFFSGITSAVKGVLGIHSPSRVYRDIGGNMGKSVGKGWDGQYGAVKKQIVRDMDQTAAAAEKAAELDDITPPALDASPLLNTVDALGNEITAQMDHLSAQAPEWGREFVDGLRRGIQEGAAPLLQDMGNLREDLRGAFTGEMAAAQRRLDRSMAQLPRGVQEETAGRRRDWADQNAPLDYDALAQAVKRGLDGSVVSMSGRKVGQLITDYQRDERRAKGS